MFLRFILFSPHRWRDEAVLEETTGLLMPLIFRLIRFVYFILLRDRRVMQGTQWSIQMLISSVRMVRASHLIRNVVIGTTLAILAIRSSCGNAAMIWSLTSFTTDVISYTWLIAEIASHRLVSITSLVEIPRDSSSNDSFLCSNAKDNNNNESNDDNDEAVFGFSVSLT